MSVCYICGRLATYIVHSHPDTVRLCAAHSWLHPVEPHETRCLGLGCLLCDWDDDAPVGVVPAPTEGAE